MSVTTGKTDARLESASSPSGDKNENFGGGDKVIVLKIGGSTLRQIEDLPRVAGEIYRHVRQGHRVVAVVSALIGETDQLRASIAGVGAGLSSHHSAGVAGLGEVRAAYFLAMACDHCGVDTFVLDAKEHRMRGAGHFDDATPVGVDQARFAEVLSSYEATIVPGYVALDETGAPVLLGRGGADLTAVAIAEAVGAEQLVFITDAGALYESDPYTPDRTFDTSARAYSRVSWSDARAAVGEPIQSKALEYAERRQLEFHVAPLGGAPNTAIGEVTSQPAPLERRVPTDVAVAGLGVVGEGATLRIVGEPSRWRLVKTLVSNPDKTRHRQINPSLVTVAAGDVIDARPGVLLDLMSDGAAGLDLIRHALKSGIHVVSANKQAIADDLADLHALASANGAVLAYSPAVGGGAPMVETARRARGAGSVAQIDAILNGTVNYILSQMAQGQNFEDALRSAQDAGFAEADPSADLSGDDARAKVKILAYEAFGVSACDVELDIEPLTAEKAAGFAAAGIPVRQVAKITPFSGGVRGVVAYQSVADDRFLGSVTGEGNALRAFVGDQVFSCRGRGAGRAPTVESTLADVSDIVRQTAVDGAPR